MRRIEIEVSDADYQKAIDLLENLKYVKTIRDKNVEEKRERIDVTGNKYGNMHKPTNETHVPQTVDEVTLMSQQSLAEEWNSEEDARYDEYYQSTTSQPKQNCDQ